MVHDALSNPDEPPRSRRCGFAGRRDISALHVVEQALAVPMKRSDRPMLDFLTREEMLAVLGQPGSGWTSQRDHLLLAMLYNSHRAARECRRTGLFPSFIVYAFAMTCSPCRSRTSMAP
jgi:hypothetical protein